MPLVALTRAVPPTLAQCELTHLDRTPIDLVLAEAQHASYEDALRQHGCRVERVAPAPELPDSVFIEDTAIVVEELAVITRPGAESRRGETIAVAAALEKYRPVAHITAPGTIDGGDVLRIGRRIFVGSSTRTNEAAMTQLGELLRPFGYEVIGVPVGEVLHLKSAVTAVGPATVLLNPSMVDRRVFSTFEVIEVDPDEPNAANALLVGGVVFFPSAFPRTRARLGAAGIRVRALDATEVAKAEGALTCCSILLEDAF